MLYDQRPRYVSPEEAAQALRVNVNSLYRALRAGEVPSIRVGRAYAIPLSWFGIHYDTPVLQYRDNLGMHGQMELPLGWNSGAF